MLKLHTGGASREGGRPQAARNVRKNDALSGKTGGWARYAAKHRPSRISDFPAGIDPPGKVRLYRRHTYYMLQWWDPPLKKTLAERVDGDLIDAVSRAREIDGKLKNFKSTGRVAARITHRELVDRYEADLWRRANAGEIDPKSAARYLAPLRRHYLTFAAQVDVARRYRHAGQVDREFQLEFLRFLQFRNVSPSGDADGGGRPLVSWAFVLDVVRGMYHWAADPDRGKLLPEGFRNPFIKRQRSSRIVHPGGPWEPDITTPMAAEFLSACDAFQLPIFATLALYGLRPGELGWIFRSDVCEKWVRILNHPELNYYTKGRRDKQFPIVSGVQAAWGSATAANSPLLFQNRPCLARGAAIANASYQDLALALQGRRSQTKDLSARQERRLRDGLLKEAGQLTYDHVHGEFDQLAAKLGWPPKATLKDFRHLFSTSLENAGVPESYRKFFMGHSPGRQAIVTYTHLNKLRQHFEAALDAELRPLSDAVTQRAFELGLTVKR